MDNPIVAFYKVDGVDHQGRNWLDLQELSLDALERWHDYIQWLFPLRESSAFSLDAPLLTDADVAEFLANPALRSRMIDSLQMMLHFYGLELDETGERPVVTHNGFFDWRSTVWLTSENHNFRRLTRILRSLRLLGSPEFADALFACLEKIAEEFPDEIGDAVDYWRDS